MHPATKEVEMRYFFDTEFIDRPFSLQLISIGMVSEDGREFYGENDDVDWTQASHWVMQNVAPYVGHFEMDLIDIQIGLRKLIGNDREPEFWAYNGAYDWVLFAWLFKSILNFPRSWPKRHYELQELMVQADTQGYTLNNIPVQKGQHHNALEDAKWNRELFQYLHNLMMRPPTTS